MQRTVESECSVDFSHKHDPKLKGVDDVPNLGMITRLHMAVARSQTLGFWTMPHLLHMKPVEHKRTTKERHNIT